MPRYKRQSLPEIKDLQIYDTSADGKAVGKYNEIIVFVPFVVPGDVADVQPIKKRKSFMEAKVIRINEYSDKRTEPECQHFGLCGGCKWQNMKYSEQLFFKSKQVVENLKRIGKIELPDISPILGSEKIYNYRNKLEFTFSNKKWLTDFSKEINFEDRNMNGLGFHKPGMWDRIIDIEKCHLQEEPSNAIRLAVKNYSDEHKLDYYDVKLKEGFLRNLIIRTTSTGELMIIVVFNYLDKGQIDGLLGFLGEKFPEINSLMYVINPKPNDTIYDLDAILFKGEPFIMEQMENLRFKIGPKSFYQTNSDQAYELYKVAREFADLKGEEVVYDLYTGTGTIALFIAAKAQKIVGIESVPEAIEDAKENAILNGIENTDFFAGDMLKVLNDDFVSANGYPDVIITDPPRVGMHEKVVKQILSMKPEKIVYVSCNPATQARDVALLDEAYVVKRVQPVDMFPHTHHVENVLLLERRQ